MSDYVEVGKILEFLDAETNALNSTFGEIDGEAGAYVACFKNVRSYIERFPTTDVAPVVHSYWESYSCSQYMGTDGWGEPKWRDGRFYICHNYKCRRKTAIKSNYCPNCGARMDLEETDG